ncbi:MAG: 16S rRNA (uracil(1498)-N(3))-methyltransferase [Clostridiales bacterium]|jgi:16S rRNA (uracil1498-N3)-methyltransferase|nr:16S rRNA (uracil(1498)-N(3))-methyltransferase [Clostridiales bacterium]
MDIRRFYGKKRDNNIILEGDEYHHCAKVLRHKIGFHICAFTGDGKDYFAVITDITGDSVIADIYREEENFREGKNRIILCQALCKEFDFIIQKSVELGVNEIIPFTSARTTFKGHKTMRSEKIILDAVKQSERSIIPKIHDTIKFDDVLKLYPNFKNRMLCYEKSKDLTLNNQISWIDRDVMVIIGPEGGFADDEISSAKRAGLKITSLSKRVLRSETAAIVAIILIQSKYEDL